MAVMGGLTLLRSRIPKNPVTERLIDDGLKAAERGATLTKQLLAFGRKQELNYEAIDLAALIHGSLAMIQLSLGSSVTTAMEVPPGLPKVRSDKNQLVNAILNLALNARDAMPGGGKVTIRAELGQRDGQENVCLSVADQGKGMDEATLADATLPFFTTKGVGKGTGLGLSMVSGFMEQSGGKLLISTELGVGTEAQLWLSLAEGEDLVCAPHERAAAPDTSQPLNILAVDDDDLVLSNTVLMLEDLGHVVVAAPSAREALKILDEIPSFDLILTDHAMPNMTGSQLADAVRRREPRIKCILATGYVEAAARGDLPTLAKPFTQAQLHAIVESVMVS